MYPYIDVGPLHLGTFGLLLWLGGVVAALAMQRNFARNGVQADALGIVAAVVIAGILGAKTWHELQDVAELRAAMEVIGRPGWGHPGQVLLLFLNWFKAGFAWFGGLLAGIAVLMWSGVKARPNGMLGWRGAVRMLDLAAPEAALGYGVGRIGCLTSGDGDYGMITTLPWGVHMRPDALVPPTPPGALVQPTPGYEFLFGLLVFWILWRLGRSPRPLGWLTGLYLLLSGAGRFLVEFVRINPKLYWGLSNAQVAALASVLAGGAAMLLATVARTPEPVAPVEV